MSYTLVFGEKAKLNQKILFLGLIAVLFVFTNTAFAESSTKSDIKYDTIKCKPGKSLMTKSNHSVCVKASSVKKLVTRGWSITIDNTEIIRTAKQDTEQKTNKIKSNQNTAQNPYNIKSNQVSTNPNVIYGTSPDKDTNIPMIMQWYNDYYVGIDTPELGPSLGSPLPVLNVNYTVTSTQPNSIKILFIGMSPNLLKVGDEPYFTITWQNISNETIYQSDNYIVAPPIGLAIEPSEKIRTGFAGYSDMATGSGPSSVPVNPGQIRTSVSAIDPTFGHYDFVKYKDVAFRLGTITIIKPGPLHVTLELLSQSKPGAVDMIDTIKFDITATP